MDSVFFSSFVLVVSTFCSIVAGYAFQRRGSSIFFVFSNSELSLDELKQRGNRLSLGHNEKLLVVCQLVDKTNWDITKSNELTEKYALVGLQPYITFKNKTWWKTYRFPPLKPSSRRWRLEIARDEFLQGANDVIFEPWFIKIELGFGLGLFETKGILIPDLLYNISRNLGNVVDSSVMLERDGDLVVKSAPCTSDISFVLPFKNKTALSVGGCFIGITFGSFTPNTFLWLDLCPQKDNRSLCLVFPQKHCDELRILDLLVTRTYIIIATSFGLVRSASFKHLVSDNILSNMNYQEILFGFMNHTAYGDAELHYTTYCLDFHIFNEEQDIFYLLDKHSRKSIYKSISPFTQLLKISLSNITFMNDLHILGVVSDVTKNTHILLCLLSHKSVNWYVVVAITQGTNNYISFPPWYFPEGSVATHLSYHSWSNTLFVYGSQVWQSRDGGNYFDQLTELTLRHMVTTILFPQYGDTVVAVTDHGTIFKGRIGTLRLVAILHQPFTDLLQLILVDELENIIGVFRNDSGSSVLLFGDYFTRIVHPHSYQSQYCNHDVLLQFINRKEVLLFISSRYGDTSQQPRSYCFGSYTFGQVYKSRHGGVAHITEVTHLNSSSGFFARVRAKVVETFTAESSSSNSLRLLNFDIHVRLVQSDIYNTVYEVSSHTGLWSINDEGKTVILTNGMSVLLKKYFNESLMYALAPPGISPSLLPQGTQNKRKWQLYDLRSGKITLERKNDPLVVGKSSEGFEASGSFNFNNSHIGNILMISDNIFGAIHAVEGSNKVIFLNNSIMEEGTFFDWNLYQPPLNVTELTSIASNTGYGMWWIEEEDCANFPIVTPKEYKALYHLDSRDNITLEFSVLLKHFEEVDPQITMFVGNPSLFKIQSMHIISDEMHSLQVTLERKPGTYGLAQMSFSVRYTSLQCPSSSNILTIHGGCPPSKRLVFHYPQTFTHDTFLHGFPLDNKGILRNFKLPANYRPPSSRGIGIPLSSNLYNVFPEKPPYKEKFGISRETRLYKQCQGKSFRRDCRCGIPDNLNMSRLVVHSDCINTVYRLIFHEIFKPQFTIVQEDALSKPFQDPYYLVELNQRLDYNILRATTMTESGRNIKVLQDSLNSSVEFTGSGLYHFRAYAVKESFTMCDLTDEFIVFVDEMPLPHPARDIVRISTAMAFVSASFFAYLWYFYLANKGELNQVFREA